jgi:signal transduction histidine kinase
MSPQAMRVRHCAPDAWPQPRERDAHRAKAAPVRTVSPTTTTSLIRNHLRMTSITRHFGLARPTDLHLVVGLFCMILGAEALVLPTRFVVSVLSPIAASGALIPIWGLAFLLGGTLLVGASALRLPRSLHVAAGLVCGALLLIVAYPRGAAHEWPDSAVCVCLALGTVVGSLLPRERAPDGPAAAADLLSLVLGVGSLAAGCVLLALPMNQFPATFADVGAERYWYGTALVAGGLALLACVRLDRNRGISIAARFLGAAALVTYGLRVPLPQHAWAGVALYLGFGAALALQPFGRERLDALEPLSLRVRLVLTLITVAGLPLIVAVTAIANAAETAALADAAADQEVAARGISRAATQFDHDYRALVTTIATRGGLAGLTPEQQAEVLRGLVATDVFAFSTYDANGQPRVRTDQAELVPLAPALVADIQRTRQASVIIDTVPGTERLAFVFAAPLLVPDGDPTGYVAASIEANRADSGIARLGAVQRADARVFLVDAQGRSLAQPDPATTSATDLSREAPVAAALSADQSSGSLQYRSGNSFLVAGYARVPELDWVAVVTFPTASVLRGVRAGRELAFGVLLVAAAISAAFGLFVADRFIRPLSALGKAAEGVAGDDDSTSSLPHSSFAEVDRLATIFGTMRRRLHARTAEREAALESAREAVRVREEFVSVAAHELKTPVTALRGQAQLLLRRLDRDEPADSAIIRTSAERIDAQSRKLSRLVQQVLDVARLERGLLSLDRQPLDVCEVVEEVLADSPYQDRTLAYLSDVHGSMLGDRLRLEQVLMNLIDNAAKFSPDGGPIEITVAAHDDHLLRIAVRDYGLGIPTQHRDRVFERFYQAHGNSHRSGLGLGLYIAKQIVDLHDGQMRVEFPSDGGTRFVVDLPLAVSSVSPAVAEAVA